MTETDDDHPAQNTARVKENVQFVSIDGLPDHWCIPCEFGVTRGKTTENKTDQDSKSLESLAT